MPSQRRLLKAYGLRQSVGITLVGISVLLVLGHMSTRKAESAPGSVRFSHQAWGLASGVTRVTWGDGVSDGARGVRGARVGFDEVPFSSQDPACCHIVPPSTSP